MNLLRYGMILLLAGFLGACATTQNTGENTSATREAASVEKDGENDPSKVSKAVGDTMNSFHKSQRSLIYRGR